jgi:excisionase family DNA binding protein
MSAEVIPLDRRVVLWTSEAAAYLGVSRKTVQRMCQQGKIPCGHVNGKYVLRLDALDRWAKSQVKEPEDQAPDVPRLAMVVPSP